MDDENKVMPDLIEPLIGPVRTTNPDSVMKNKVIEGSKNIASFLQCGMPQLRLPISRMSNPDIQKLMHDIRKNAKQKPNIAERRRARMAAKAMQADPPSCDVSLRNIRDGLQEFAEVAKEKLAELGPLCNDAESREKVEEVVRDLDPNFDWAALQRLRKSGEGLY